MVSGSLLVLDATATLVWQEPVSWAIAESGQSDLERRLATIPARPQESSAVAARRLAARAKPGDPIGRISLPTLERTFVMVEGVGTSPLRKGPGHYPDTPLPGEPGTVAVAGHRTTYLAPFRSVDRLRRGQPNVVEMPYGRFVYRVERPASSNRRRSRSPAAWATTGSCSPPATAVQRGEADRRVRAARALRTHLSALEPARPAPSMGSGLSSGAE